MAAATLASITVMSMATARGRLENEFIIVHRETRTVAGTQVPCSELVSAPRSRTVRYKPRRADALGMTRRAYTLLEVVGATVMFVLTVSLLASTTASVISSKTALRRSAQIDSVLDRLLDQVSTNSFTTLLADTFEPPLRCAGDPQSAGTLSRSCTTVGSQAVTVSWLVTRGKDSANPSGPLEAADDVTVTATVTRPDGSASQRSRTVAAPYPGYRAGYATVRVLLGGEPALLDSPVLLLSGATFQTIQDAQMPSSSGALVLRAPASACTTSSPCRLGLNTGTSRGMTSSFTLDAQAAVGAAGLIVLSDGRVADVRATIRRTTRAVLTIDATHSNGKRHNGGADPSPEANSVCAYLTFSDGVAQQSVPSCNADQKTIRFYDYDPDNSGVKVGVPSNVPVSVSSDMASQPYCPVVAGQRYHTGSAWATVSTVGVCSSWTWGRPAQLIVPSDTSSPYTIPAAVTLPAGTTFIGVLSWNSGLDATGAPASGWGYQPTFAKPRNATLCPGWTTGACQPTWINNGSTAAPEVTGGCPTAYCYSTINAAPSLPQITYGAAYASSTYWPYAPVMPASATTPFRTFFQDNEASAVTVTLTALPTTGTLQLCNSAGASCVTATLNQVVGAGIATTSSVLATAYLAWQYVAPASGSPWFTIRISDGTNTRDETVLLPSSTQAVAVQPLSTAVAQQAVVSQYGFVWSSDGAVSSGTVAWTAAPTGSAYSTPVAATASGVASVTLAGSTAPGAVVNTQAAVGAWPTTRFATPDVAILPRPYALTFSASSLTVQQSKTTTPTQTVLVQDASGASMTSYPVSFGTTDPTGAVWRGVFFAPPVCVTGVGGTCTIPPLSASAGAKSQTGTLYAKTGSVAKYLELAVTKYASRVLSSVPSFAQSSSGTLTITVADATGSALSGQILTLQAPTGITLSKTSLTTGSNGTVTVGVTVAAGVASGGQYIQSKVARGTDSDLVVPLGFVVIPTPSSASLSSATLSVTRGSTGYVTVTVLDGASAPSPGAYETATCTAPLVKISSQLSSDATGSLLVAVAPSATASVGSTTCTITVGSLTALTLTVAVS